MARVGERIGNIRIVELLGAGGMGEVYEGFDETLQRRVALKTIRGRRRLSTEARARFLREARILSQLEHPNICRIYDFVTHEDVDALVLELIEGRTLDHALAENPSFPQRLSIALEIAKVLAAAHAEGIVHRDLKPSNVMMTPDGLVKVLDFGLARTGEGILASRPETVPLTTPPTPAPTEPTESGDGTFATLSESPTVARDERTAASITGGPHEALTEHGTVMGTPVYMSPEQARGEPLSTASDMYSFGLLLQTLFTGGFPYPRGIGPTELLARAARGETLPVTGVPSDLTALIDRLKSLAPAARPTAVEAHERLAWIRDKPKRRLRRLAATAVVLVIGLAGLKYTLDLRRERGIAVEARREADQRRGQAEALIGFMLGDLRAKLEPMGKLEILDDVGDEAMEYFAAVNEEELSDDELLSRSRALYQIGEVRIAQGNLKGAMDPLQESLALTRSLVERNPDDGDRLFEEGQGHFWVGYVHWRRGDLEAALGQFRDYLAISERLVGMNPENLDWRLELAYAYSNIGSILQARGDLEGALDRFEAALEIKQTLVAAAPENTGWQFDLARSHNTVGYILESRGDFQGALRQYGEELAIKEGLLAGQPSHAQWKFELAINLNIIAALRTATGDVDGGLELYGASIEKLTELTEQDPSNSRWKRELAITLSHRGNSLMVKNVLAAARAAIERSVRLLEGLTAHDPSDSTLKLDRATSLTRLGLVLARDGDLVGAQAAGEAAREDLEALVARRADDLPARAALSSAHGLLGTVWSLRGKPDRASAAWTQAVEVIQDMAPGSSDRRLLVPWVRALLHLGRLQEARPAFERLTSFGYRSAELQQLWDGQTERAEEDPKAAQVRNTLAGR